MLPADPHATGAELRLIDVVESARLVPTATSASGAETDEQRLEARGKALKAQAEANPVRGPAPEIDVVWDTPYLETVEEVVRYDHDLVVKTARGACGRGPRFGSTALHPIRKSPSSVCSTWWSARSSRSNLPDACRR
jgi:nucleotide-binding universal stress UspA family protein